MRRNEKIKEKRTLKLEEVGIDRKKGVAFFKIKEQSHRGTKFGLDDEPSYPATNGMILVSSDDKERRWGAAELECWSDDESKDGKIMCEDLETYRDFAEACAEYEKFYNGKTESREIKEENETLKSKLKAALVNSTICFCCEHKNKTDNPWECRKCNGENLFKNWKLAKAEKK